MLRRLFLRNFRAFKSQPFEFSKINIFVGPNNSGKSSAISAINLIAQTVASTEIDQSPLVINGSFDTLGTYLDLVHGNRSNTPLGFDISFDEFEIKLEYKYRQQRREIELVRFELFENDKQVIFYITRKDSFTLKLFGNEIEKILPGMRKRRPAFRNVLPLARFYNPLIFDRERNILPEGALDFLRRADRSTVRARVQLRNLFDEFDSLSPFREKPQRTYLYSGESAQRIGVTGGNTAVILSSDTARRGSESRNIADEISRWFRVSGIADEVRIKSLTPRHFEIAVVDRNGTEHNICDVGFGCSQVLPVLTASLKLFGMPRDRAERRQAMLVIQEPEIHLHPNAQASLGSFFAGLLQHSGQLFIETHSDNLVLRVARHVADGTLAAEDVKIFYVHKKGGSSTVNEIAINKDGTFATDWPGGFFPQRQNESLSLAQEAYLAEKRAGRTRQLRFRYPEERR